MRRDASQQGNPDQLELVRSRFRQFRSERRGSRQRFPDELRGLVLAAIDAGHPKAAVAEAAGIDRNAFGRWRREANAAPSPTASGKVRELHIVKHRQETPPPTVASAGTLAVVRIGHHIAVDLPAAALTESFLRALVASGGGVS